MILTNESQELLKEIRDSCLFCCIDFKSDYCFVWDVNYVSTKGNSHTSINVGTFEDLNVGIAELYHAYQVELQRNE